MNCLIADTFTNSLGRLTGDEQKAVKTTAFDLQLNPASPGMQFHKLDKARDKNFWSVRVSSDIRLIVHRTDQSLLLCYVDHHDKAYDWAERRKPQNHPTTGAAQIVELRETIQEIIVPTYVDSPAIESVKRAARSLFDDVEEETLMGYGVPIEWLGEVREATEESLFDVIEHLPGEAGEALLQLATGAKPPVPEPAVMANAFEHPDARRRFRLVGTADELAQALELPWDKWTVFLHPDQRELVERDYAGPARVSGSAGTGKTIVALHRTVYLARRFPDARVLLTTFSDGLATALRRLLVRLTHGEPRLAERIDVLSISDAAKRLSRGLAGSSHVAEPERVNDLIRQASAATSGHRFSESFLRPEWWQIVDAWQLDSWEAYRDVARLGRKTQLSEPQRRTLWSIFERVQESLRAEKLITEAALFTKLAAAFAPLTTRSVSKAPDCDAATRSREGLADAAKEKAEGLADASGWEVGRTSPYDFVVVDEAQDVSVAQLRFLAALGGGRKNALFFAGDLGQRIFPLPFSWKSPGVDVRGRSKTLRVNYRTSHQIRSQADRLLGPSSTDVDGNTDDRTQTVSVFDGPPPLVSLHESEVSEIKAVADWLTTRRAAGCQPHEVAVFVRSTEQLPRARLAVQQAGLRPRVLDEGNLTGTADGVAISTMYFAKGLEFRAVAVMACDDEIIPLQERIQNVGDDADLHEIYETERHLLDVACTHARDALLVTAVMPESEFLDDLRG
jgi:superfamily I DNA/RNA helicase/mRNA-degrading endonuclease RelE of RelBE toxin-antitoxin system